MLIDNTLQITNINLAVYKWMELLDIVSNTHIVRREQNVPRPVTGSYIGYKLTSGPFKVGFNDNIEHKIDSTFTNWGQRELIYSVQTFRESANQIAAYIHDSQEILDVRDLLRTFNVAIIDVSTPLDISYGIETGFEERAEVTIRLRANAEWDVDLGAIETTQIVGTLTSDSGNEIIV